ncbi:hypothetical protein E2C01_064776 [Portunus trituberculatus]|uniref:Uncharacterized protein n=1 Tax=Portunus trituberculatus TaxID=210409 RepID=A0A5B7HLR9_PORTR|nr:hypothetical protein [Portunus trituberculatus]
MTIIIICLPRYQASSPTQCGPNKAPNNNKCQTVSPLQNMAEGGAISLSQDSYQELGSIYCSIFSTPYISPWCTFTTFT